MQTFLPFEDFTTSANCLDMRRLGKQRVEVLQILEAISHRTGWIHHPCTKMWTGYGYWLCKYGEEICKAWRYKGYQDTCLPKIQKFREWFPSCSLKPPWLGNPLLHQSHRSNLIRKKPEYYRDTLGWNDPDDLPYWWP